MFREEYQWIQDQLRAITGKEDVELVDGGEHADLATTLAFTLAKEERRSPVEIARDLAGKLRDLEKDRRVLVETKGPYINFSFGSAYLKESLKAALEPGYGKLPPKEERVALEHTSANPNGPLHVGHIRNSVLGDTLTRAYRKCGYRVESQYYVNDIGRQIAIVVWGLSHLGMNRQEGEKGDHYIARVYIAANRAMESDPAITSQIDHLMQEVEHGELKVV